MTQNKVKIFDKEFDIYITYEKIIEAVNGIADRINLDFKNKEILFISILNGSFIFSADLFKRLTINCKISFLKMTSYTGTSSTGNIKKLIGLNEDIQNKNVIILEDIIDTGNTIDYVIKEIQVYNPAELKICTLLLKNDVYSNKYKIDYYGFQIPNDFVIGYGLDYNGFGRNYKNIYKIIK